jgi:hypothetical protein
MKKLMSLLVLLSFCTLLLTVPILAEERIELDLIINQNGSATLFNSRTFFGIGRITQTFSDYSLSLFDKNNMELKKSYIPVSFLILDPTQEVDEIPVTVNLPYSQDYKQLKVFDNNNAVILQQDLTHLCNLNDVCDFTENTVSCPDDCPSGAQDLFCDRIEDGKCDADCLFGDNDCHEGASNAGGSSLLTFLGGIFVLFAAFLMWYYMIRKKENR